MKPKLLDSKNEEEKLTMKEKEMLSRFAIETLVHIQENKTN